MKNKLKDCPVIKYIYYRIIAILNYILEVLVPPGIPDYHEIPVIINNFNRLDTLIKLIDALEKRGYHNIHIIDNFSTYPPLIDFYSKCRYDVIRLEKNLGMNALWVSGLFRRFRRDFFVYTDSDIVPVEECPEDFMLIFLNALKKFRFASKVGFSLKIDDIPDTYAHKEEVLQYEEPHFKGYLRDNQFYLAPIDTTFALYRPRAKRRHAGGCIEMYRAAYPYMARHLPWYTDSNNPDEETRYYLEHIKMKTSWSRRSKSLL